MTQLELLAWRPPAQIVAFPLCRSLEVRIAADVLLACGESDLRPVWAAIVNGHRETLLRLGMEAEKARYELIRFREAVQIEIWGRERSSGSQVM